MDRQWGGVEPEGGRSPRGYGLCQRQSVSGARGFVIGCLGGEICHPAIADNVGRAKDPPPIMGELLFLMFCIP